MYKLLIMLIPLIHSSLEAMEKALNPIDQELINWDRPRPKYDHPLLMAAHSATLDEVKAIVEGTGTFRWITSLITPDLSPCDWLGKNALHVAAERGSEELITYFVEKGIPIDCLNEAGETPLYVASLFGHLGAVQTLSRLGATKNRIGKKNPLSIASHCGRTSVVAFLLEQGVEATEEDLFEAADNGHTDVCRLLIRAGVKPGQLPILSVAMSSGKKDLAQRCLMLAVMLIMSTRERK